MIKIEELKIITNERVSEHILYSIEGATKLVVLFPGGNSNTSRPLFHYLIDYFVRNNHDVLALSYKNLPEGHDTFEEKIRAIIEAAYKAIMVNHDTKPYDEYIFVSRSVGNVMANRTKIDYNIDVAKSIYVSPIPEALDNIEKYPGLLITATEDEYLNEENFKKIETFSEHEIIIFEGGDHGLECDNTLESIDFCKKCVSRIIDFVNN